MKVKISQIEWNKWTRPLNKAHVARLKKSMERRGQLQGLLVTASFPQHVSDPHKLLGVDGHHRFAAITELFKEGKWEGDEVDVLTRKYDTESELMEACAAGNIHCPTQPWEDAALMQDIFGVDDPPTVEEVAASLGVNKDWVIRRRRLVGLTPKMLKAWKKHPEVSTALMETVALLPAIHQDGNIASFTEADKDGRTWDVEGLLEAMQRQSCDLTSAPWDTKDFAPDGCHHKNCSACPRNTANQRSLFTAAELKEVGKQVCLEKSCFDLKFEAWLDVKTTEFKEAHDNGKLLATSYGEHDLPTGTLTKNKWCKAAKTAAGAFPGLLINGEDIGKVIYAKLVIAQAVKQEAKAEAAKADPVKADKEKVQERTLLLANKRAKHVIEAFIKAEKNVSTENILVAVDVFGTQYSKRTLFDKLTTKFEFKGPATYNSLWKQVWPVMVCRWTIRHLGADAPRIIEEVRQFAKLIGFDLKLLEAAAEHANPIPKSWKQ